MNLTFQPEGWSAVEDDLRDACRRQYEEIALYRDITPLSPNWPLYFQWAKERKLKVLTVRDSGRLVGWHLSLVGFHPHYDTTLFGMQDMYYVLPEYRSMPTVGLRLFAEMEEFMRSAGVKRLIGNTKLHLDRSALFEFMDWQKTGLIYEKVL